MASPATAICMGRNLPQRLGNPAPANEADEALLAKQRDMLLAARDKRTAAVPRRARSGRLERPCHRGAGPRRHGVRAARMDPGRHQGLRCRGRDFGRARDNSLLHIGGQRRASPMITPTWRAPRCSLREVTGDDRFLAQAKAWTQGLNDHFWNNQINGYASMPTMPNRCSCVRAWCSTIPRPAPTAPCWWC